MTKKKDRNSLFELARRKSRIGQRGFTLIELMIVITIILILIGIAAGNYQRSVLRAREAVAVGTRELADLQPRIPTLRGSGPHSRANFPKQAITSSVDRQLSRGSPKL